MPTKLVETVEEAVPVLNEHEWGGRSDWGKRQDDWAKCFWLYSDLIHHEIPFSYKDGIAIANSLILEARVAELEAENQHLCGAVVYPGENAPSSFLRVSEQLDRLKAAAKRVPEPMNSRGGEKVVWCTGCRIYLELSVDKHKPGCWYGDLQTALEGK